MSEITPHLPGLSPFDAIRHVRPEGSEFWSARELMPLLGYEQWRRFDDAIDRAVVSCRNAGVDAGENFLQTVQRVGDSDLGRELPQVRVNRLDARLDLGVRHLAWIHMGLPRPGVISV